MMGVEIKCVTLKGKEAFLLSLEDNKNELHTLGIASRLAYEKVFKHTIILESPYTYRLTTTIHPRALRRSPELVIKDWIAEIVSSMQSHGAEIDIDFIIYEVF